MTKQMGSYIWKVCENCTIRNCRSEPILVNSGYVCNKRVKPRGGVTLLDSAMKRNPESVLKLAWLFGFRVEETPETFELKRRPLKEGEYEYRS